MIHELKGLSPHASPLPQWERENEEENLKEVFDFINEVKVPYAVYIFDRNNNKKC